MSGKDWRAWHEPYDDESSALSRRLRLVQGHIALWLDQNADRPVAVVSACAGEGRDLLGVLGDRSDAHRVRLTLIENDERNVVAARAAADAASIPNATIRHADAGELASYVGAVPADLVLMAGVFGNISDAGVRRTIDALHQLCAENATVIWTRSRRRPDLTPAIRGWLRSAGFVERSFDAPDDVLWSVGVNRFVGTPQQLNPDGKLFEFVV